MAQIVQSNPSYFFQQNEAEVLKCISDVIASGWYVLGQQVEQFETNFSSYCETVHSIGVANGTDAIEIALRALGVTSGDLVATVSHTAVATASAIARIGAIPVFIDISSDTYTMCPSSLEQALEYANRGGYGKRAISAVIPVHIYGCCAEMNSIMKLASNYAIKVVEDCAQSHGARYNGRKSGSLGDAGAFSFYPTKNLGALGDGGAVVTNNASTNEKIRNLRQYGWDEKRNSTTTGMNSRLDELHAAILDLRLKHLDEENRQRQLIAHDYSKYLEGLPIRLPTENSAVYEHVYHQYVIRTEKRDLLASYLKDKGISTAIHYSLPVHQQNAYKNNPFISPSGLGVTEDVCKHILSLPMYPSLKLHNIESICYEIRNFFN